MTHTQMGKYTHHGTELTIGRKEPCDCVVIDSDFIKMEATMLLCWILARKWGPPSLVVILISDNIKMLVPIKLHSITKTFRGSLNPWSFLCHRQPYHALLLLSFLNLPDEQWDDWNERSIGGSNTACITCLIRPTHFLNQTMEEIQTPMIRGMYVSTEDLEFG